MREGERSAAVDTWVARLQETAGRLRLRNATERAAFAHLLALRDERAAGRRERLSEADPVITAPIWLILGLRGIVAVLLALVFSDRRERFLVQASLMAAFTTVVAGGLILVWSLDDPYRDATGSITPVEMQRSITIMHERRPSLVLPCTPGATHEGHSRHPMPRGPTRCASSSSAGPVPPHISSIRPSEYRRSQPSSVPQLWIRVKVVPHLPASANSPPAARRSEASSSPLSVSSSRDSSATLN
jgi:hypothetical protein